MAANLPRDRPDLMPVPPAEIASNTTAQVPGPVVAVAWCDFQPRTVALAEALGGKASFVTGSSLRSRGGLLPARYLRDALVAWKLLQRQRPAVVIAITPPVFSPLVAWLWCRLHHAQLVIDCHTDAFHSRRWAWALPIHRWLARRAEAVTLHTEAAEREVAGWGALALLLPDDLPHLDQVPVAPAHTRPRVVVAGSLDDQEPVEAAIEAARRLPEVEVRVTGHVSRVPGSLVSGAPANVVFTGWLNYPDFLRELQAADVVGAFSLDPQIMNRAAFEAIGLGRPLVLSDHPGLRQRFAKGAIYCANDSDSIAASLRQAISEQEQLALESTRARARLLAQHGTAVGRLRSVLSSTSSGWPGRHRRVLMVSQHPYPELAPLRRNVDYLLSQGARLDLVCTVEDGDLRGSARPGLTVRPIPMRHRRTSAAQYPLEYLGFFLRALPRVVSLSLGARYDTVQVDNLPDFLVFIAALARWRGARVVLFMYELMPEMTAVRLGVRPGHPVVRLAAALERSATRFADRVIVVNESCRQVLVDRGVPAAKLEVVPNTQPRLDISSPRAVRHEVMVTHATLVERYGVQVAIRALAQLAEKRPALVLEVLGEGEYRPTLEALAAELGVGDRVTFLGYLPWAEAMAHIRDASVGIVAVIDDGYGHLLLPMKLLDYVSQGVPAVCSQLAAIENYFSPGTVAYFKPGDANGLSQQVETLLDNPSAAIEQTRRAQLAMQSLSWERVSGRYLGALAAQP